MRLPLTAVAALALTAAGPAPAQQDLTTVLVTEGIAAYNDLEFAAAARLLRRAIDGSVRPLPGAERKRALMYLGAAEHFLEQRERAVDVFRELALDDPTFRPDSLVFPPRVTRLFDEARQTTKGVAIALPAEQRLMPGQPGLAITINATSPHLITATLRTARGDVVRHLYDGRIEERIVLRWNGLDESGDVLSTGLYHVEVTSMVTPGAVLRLVRIPLDVRTTHADTLPWPPQGPKAAGAPDLRVLVPGLAAGLVLALPPLFGDVGAEGARVGLGAAVAGLGLALSLRPRREAGAPVAEEWQRSVARVREENARRRRTASILVSPGVPQRMEGTGERNGR